MSDTIFVNGITLSDQDWFNDLNRLHYTIFLDAATAAAARANIVVGPKFSTEATASTVAVEFTSIPVGVRRITLSLNGISLDGDTEVSVQIGDSGGYEGAAYNGSSMQLSNGSSPIATNPTTGWNTTSATAASTYSGLITLVNQSNSGVAWTCTGILYRSDSPVIDMFGGSKSLSGVLDKIRILSNDAVSTFDNGFINMCYEFGQ